mmetsp:Transcript_99612/g.281103  ORF Transcript_99612/g.281103 Transcript_99612/m.281103 type:complete len:251 (+) Transcript_99612:655-1407(+)
MEAFRPPFSAFLPEPTGEAWQRRLAVFFCPRPPCASSLRPSSSPAPLAPCVAPLPGASAPLPSGDASPPRLPSAPSSWPLPQPSFSSFPPPPFCAAPPRLLSPAPFGRPHLSPFPSGDHASGPRGDVSTRARRSRADRRLCRAPQIFVFRDRWAQAPSPSPGARACGHLSFYLRFARIHGCGTGIPSRCRARGRARGSLGRVPDDSACSAVTPPAPCVSPSHAAPLSALAVPLRPSFLRLLFLSPPLWAR